MGMCRIEGVNIGFEDLVKLTLIENEHVVQAFAPHTAQKTLTGGIRFRGTNGRSYDVNATRCTGKGAAVFPIIVADQESWMDVERGRFAQLLGDPGIRRGGGDSAMN